MKILVTFLLTLFFSCASIAQELQLRTFEKSIRVPCVDVPTFKIMVDRTKHRVVMNNNYDNTPLSVSIWASLEEKSIFIVVYNKTDGSVCIPLAVDEMEFNFSTK